MNEIWNWKLWPLNSKWEQESQQMLQFKHTWIGIDFCKIRFSGCNYIKASFQSKLAKAGLSFLHFQRACFYISKATYVYSCFSIHTLFIRFIDIKSTFLMFWLSTWISHLNSSYLYHSKSFQMNHKRKWKSAVVAVWFHRNALVKG